ncbi:MAG: hypothetical protein AAF391_14210, partial [Bacteroidota bacterium]
MKNISFLLALTSFSILSAQSGYPILQEDCYVKLEEGLLENIKYAQYVRLSYWGLDHQRTRKNDNLTYLEEGLHRFVIDSVFR